MNAGLYEKKDLIPVLESARKWTLLLAAARMTEGSNKITFEQVINVIEKGYEKTGGINDLLESL